MDGLTTLQPGSRAPRRIAFGGLFRHLAIQLRNLAARAVEGLSRQAINRRVLYQLGGMSDRELRDIGLVRQDVTDAATLGPNMDSTSLLMARRNERRGARRR